MYKSIIFLYNNSNQIYIIENNLVSKMKYWTKPLRYRVVYILFYHLKTFRHIYSLGVYAWVDKHIKAS